MTTVSCIDSHPELLSNVTEQKDFVCFACQTLGSGTRKRCKNCKFDFHEYCTACPTEICSPLHPDPGHFLRRVFLRKAAAALPAPLERACDVCGEEVDGLYYQCAACQLDVHPICHQVPRELPHPVIHPQHYLVFGRHGHHNETSACMVCGQLLNFWWYRCVEASCAAARVDVHPECLVDPAVEAANEERVRSLRPNLQQQQQPYYSAPSYHPPPPHNHHHHQQQQHYQQQQQNYPTYENHDPYFHRLNTFPRPGYAFHYAPLPHQITHSHSAHLPGYSPHMHTQYWPQTAANAVGFPNYNGGSTPPTPYHNGGEGNPPGKFRRRIFALVGKILLTRFGGLAFEALDIPSPFG